MRKIVNSDQQSAIRGKSSLDARRCPLNPFAQSPKGFTSASEGENENGFSFFRSAAEANPRQSRGFTLLVAVLVSGILLALGLGIYNIISKDLILSASGRESQFAFFAADSGIECALYWDAQSTAFNAGGLATIQCGGGDVALTSAFNPAPVLETTFTYSLGAAQTDPCTSVLVQKNTVTFETVVKSYGYNTCVTTNPRRIERAIEIQY